MHLEEMKREVINLKLVKGFGNNATEKLLWAFSELGELTDMHKKGVSKWYISDKKAMTLRKFKTLKEFQHAKAIELIDVIFYLLDYASCEFEDINLDEVFAEKLALNLKRDIKYGIDESRFLG